jgi:Yip1 domain/zinc-ribbon domain
MDCPKCGATLAEGVKFCGNCGTNLAASPAAPPASASSSSSSSSAPPSPVTPSAAPTSSAAMQGLIERVKNILLTPVTEWPVIEREATTAANIYKGYVAPLAAIGVIAAFIGLSMFGVGGLFRIGIGAGLVLAIVKFALAFVSVFVVAWLVDVLAPTFGGQRDSLRALKVTAYSLTPMWVAGIMSLIPALAIVGLIAALYGLYLLYLGLPVLMRNPQDKSLPYTIVVVLCSVVIFAVFGTLSTCMIGGSMLMGAGMMGRNVQIDRADTAVAADVLSNMMGGKTDADRARMNDAMQTLSKLGEQADKAEKAARAAGTNPQAAGANAVDLSTAMAAATTMLAGGKKVDLVDFHTLKEMLPSSLPGMNRDEASGQSGEAMGMKGSSATARYSDDAGRSIEIEIADIGSLSGLAGLARKFDPNMEKETDSGYERTRRVNGQLVHEEYNRRAKSGELSVLAADRFAVSVRGSGVDADALAGALAQIDVRRLTTLAAK